MIPLLQFGSWQMAAVPSAEGSSRYTKEEEATEQQAGTQTDSVADPAK